MFGFSKYKKNSLGVDSTSPVELLQCPPIAKQSLCKSYSKSLENFVVPHQQLITLNSALGKPGGGNRTVALTPMWYRGFCRNAESVSDWALVNTPSFDKAGKGKSAIVAAALRNLRAEFHNVLGYVVVGAFNDIEKFFDSIKLESLFHATTQHSFPKGVLVIALAQHTAPRVIKIAQFCSKPIPITASILAGCKFSRDLTMCLLKSPCEDIVEDNPDATLDTYVDDCPFTVHLRSPIRATRVAVRAMTHFKACTKKLGLSLSPKAGVVSNFPKVAKTRSKKYLIRAL